MTDNSKKIKTVAKAASFIAFLVIIGIFAAIIFGGIPAWLVSSSQGNNNYFITISGLDSVKTTGETTIMIPLPVYIDGESVFSDDFIKRVNDNPDVYRLNPDWDLSVEDTAYGEMMVLRTTKSELSDLNIGLAEFDRKFIPRLLMPVINIPGDLSLEEFTKKESGAYESCVYIGGTFSLFDEPIEFNLKYVGGGNKQLMFIEPVWKSSVHKSLSFENTSVSFENMGYSNVSVNYLISDSWN
ncbi:MAG: hypothetical protein PHI15_07955 [Methanomicrobium sp.]|nr:hypothetical protein [Methanomicrobium sp.]